jgi:hypothetical protein
MMEDNMAIKFEIVYYIYLIFDCKWVLARWQ